MKRTIFSFILLALIGLFITAAPANAQKPDDPCRDEEGNEICPHYNSFDDRVNYLDPIATMTAYCRNGGLEVWLINGYDGLYVYSISAEKARSGLSSAISTGQPVMVGDASGAQVVALPSSQYRLHDARTGYEYTFNASLCGISATATAGTSSKAPASSASSATSVPSGAVVASATDVQTTNIVKFRSSPQLGSRNVIGYVPRGTVLAVVGRSEDSQWLYIEYNGQNGWVASGFTTILNRVLQALPVVTP